MRTSKIYSLIDPVTKVPLYIGKTTRDESRRFKEHIYRSTGVKNTWINFLKTYNELPEMEIIDEVPIEDENFWEKHYISLYKGWGFKLLNKSNGGESDYRSWYLISANSKKKVYQYSLTGEFIKEWESLHSANVNFSKNKNYGSVGQVLHGLQKQAYGFYWSYIKLPYKINIKLNPIKRKVRQYDLDGNYIKTYDTLQAANIAMVGRNEGSVSCVARGAQKVAYGYFWKYEDDKIEKINDVVISDKSTYAKRKIYQYSEDGILVKIWSSMMEAQKSFTNNKGCCISDAVNGRQKSAYGYIWSRVPIKEIEKGIVKRHVGNRIIEQYDLNDNYIKSFNSIVEANLSIVGKKNSSISEALNLRQKSAYGYKWKYKQN